MYAKHKIALALALVALGGFAAPTVSYQVATNIAKAVVKDATNGLVRVESDPVWSADKPDFVKWANASHNSVTIGTRRDGSVIGEGALEQGLSVKASGAYSHAEGYVTIADKAQAHAEGFHTHANHASSHAEGEETTTTGNAAHAEGYYTTAEGYYSHAEGGYSRSEGKYSHAEGYYARTGNGTNGHDRAYSWQGANTNAYYNSHGSGTFNVNPVGGLAGFWVGETNMADHILALSHAPGNYAAVSNAAMTAHKDATNYTDAAIAAATNNLRSVDGAARVLPKYLHALDFDSTYPEDAAWYYKWADDVVGGCSARRVGGVLERNYDWNRDEAPEFVIKVPKAEGRFASVGVASAPSALTEDMVTNGRWSRWYKVLPGKMLDGINENGVVCEINVVATNGAAWEVKGDRDINSIGAVRWALDHGTSAAQVADEFAHRVYISAAMVKMGYSAHFMVADANETYIVEDGEAHRVDDEIPAMTNFRVFAADDPYGTGYERFDILKDASKSITNAWFREAYRRPFTRPTEFAAPGVGTHTETNALLAWAEANVPQGAPESLKRNGASWQSVHTSIYDLENKTLRIAVQETDDWYEFQCQNLYGGQGGGGIDGQAVTNIVNTFEKLSIDQYDPETDRMGIFDWRITASAMGPDYSAISWGDDTNYPHAWSGSGGGGIGFRVQTLDAYALAFELTVTGAGPQPVVVPYHGFDFTTNYPGFGLVHLWAVTNSPLATKNDVRKEVELRAATPADLRKMDVRIGEVELKADAAISQVNAKRGLTDMDAYEMRQEGPWTVFDTMEVQIKERLTDQPEYIDGQWHWHLLVTTWDKEKFDDDFVSDKVDESVVNTWLSARGYRVQMQRGIMPVPSGDLLATTGGVAAAVAAATNAIPRVAVDPTLTVTNASADAKVVGERLAGKLGKTDLWDGWGTAIGKGVEAYYFSNTFSPSVRKWDDPLATLNIKTTANRYGYVTYDANAEPGVGNLYAKIIITAGTSSMGAKGGTAKITPRDTMGDGEIAFLSELPPPYVPSATDPIFSNAVLAVGFSFATNEVASATYIAATNVLAQLGFDENVMANLPGGKVYGSVCGLLAALAAAVAWLRKKKVGKELAGQTFDMSKEEDVKRLMVLTGLALGATVTHMSADDSTGSTIAPAYGIDPDDATTFGDLQEKAGLSDSDLVGNL